MKISKDWIEKSKLYIKFGGDLIKGLDIGEQAKLDMYDYESRGIKCDLSRNGYYYGKKWLNWHITEYRNSLARFTLFPSEIVESYGEDFYKQYICSTDEEYVKLVIEHHRKD